MCYGMHMYVPVYTHTQNKCNKNLKNAHDIEINISNVTTRLNLLDLFFIIFTLNSPILTKLLTSFYVIVIWFTAK